MHSATLLVLLVVLPVTVLHAAPALRDDAHVIHKRSAYDELVMRALAADCEAKENKCFQDNYYKNVPATGYDKDAGCRAMKAAYKCAVQSMSGCADADTLAKYDQYIKGYDFWCPS